MRRAPRALLRGPGEGHTHLPQLHRGDAVLRSDHLGHDGIHPKQRGGHLRRRDGMRGGPARDAARGGRQGQEARHAVLQDHPLTAARRPLWDVLRGEDPGHGAQPKRQDASRRVCKVHGQVLRRHGRVSRPGLVHVAARGDGAEPDRRPGRRERGQEGAMRVKKGRGRV